jgi:hypothetical protein
MRVSDRDLVDDPGAEPVELQPRRPSPPRYTKAARPIPVTREEADAMYRPKTPAGFARDATGSRLHRLNELGLLELRTTPGLPITQGDAHIATLHAMYDKGGRLLVEPGPPVLARPVDETPPTEVAQDG